MRPAQGRRTVTFYWALTIVISAVLLNNRPIKIIEVKVARLAKKFPGCKGRGGVAVAVDSTELGRGALSAYYVRRRSEQRKIVQPWSTWLKWLVV